MASNVWTEDQFSCSVCLDTLRDPVTIPCGHSYCRGCIEKHWDQGGRGGLYSCPQCRQTFKPKPVLSRNTMLAELVEKVKTVGLAGPEDVPCDVCTGPRLRALRSCLVCVASYCEIHLQPHYHSPALKAHKTVSPTLRLEQRLCQEHHKVLELFCRCDQECICTFCTGQNHRGHETVSTEAERTEKQKELRGTQADTQQRIQDRERELLNLKEAAKTHKTTSQAMKAESEVVFAELMCFLQRTQAEVNKLLVTNEDVVASETEGLIQRLEQEIAQLKRRDVELSQLSHTDDHIHFLKHFHSLCAPLPPGEIPNASLSPELSCGVLKTAVCELRQRVEEVCKEQLASISKTEGKQTERSEELRREEMKGRRSGAVSWRRREGRGSRAHVVGSLIGGRFGCDGRGGGSVEELEDVCNLGGEGGESKEEVREENKEEVAQLTERWEMEEKRLEGDSRSPVPPPPLVSRGEWDRTNREDKAAGVVELSGEIHVSVRARKSRDWSEARRRRIFSSLESPQLESLPFGSCTSLPPLSPPLILSLSVPSSQSLLSPDNDDDVSSLKAPEPRTREELLKYACQLTLDPNTAFRQLRLSGGNRKGKMKAENQLHPNHPERFNYWRQVLCREALCGGCYYWEVEWSGLKFTVGVTYKGIDRKGTANQSRLGHNDKSWSLSWSGSSYSVWHDKTEITVPGSKASRIGVYLDHGAGNLSFYSISDIATLIHRVQTAFAKPLYAGFRLWSGVGSSVTLCQLD
ncbi:TRI47 protein, partial [Amia calva]|nr:TRI47 protein [Amia calva]